MLHSQKDSTSARFFYCNVRFSGNALLTVGCHRGNFTATLIERSVCALLLLQF
jgi:hypothetical protein